MLELDLDMSHTCFFSSVEKKQLSKEVICGENPRRMVDLDARGRKTIFRQEREGDEEVIHLETRRNIERLEPVKKFFEIPVTNDLSKVIEVGEAFPKLVQDKLTLCLQKKIMIYSRSQ